MFYKIVELIVIIILLVHPGVFGGRFSDICEWMNISPSPRGAGAGVAYYGILKGANSSLFNPAMPGLIKEREIKAHHGIMLSDIMYDSIAYLEPRAGKGSLSFIARYYATDKMQEIREGEPGDTFMNYDIAVNIGYGLPVTDTLSLGVNLKGIQSSLADISAQGIGADLGICGYPFKNTVCGLSVHNISTPVSYRRTSEYLPFFISGGVSHTLKLMKGEVDLTFALGAKYMDYKELEIGFGIEHTAYNQFSIRAGYQYNNMENQLSFPANFSAGIGINIKGLLLDYAWVPYGEMGYTHRIGLGYRFSSKPKIIKKITIKAPAAIFSPEVGQLIITVDWADIKNVSKWKIEIIDSYNLKVKTMEGAGKVNEFSWNGKGDDEQIVLDGNYTIQLIAEPEGKKYKSNKVNIIVDGTPPVFEVIYSTDEFSPDGDGKNDSLKISIKGSDNNMFDSYKFKIFNASGKKVKEFIGEKAVAEIIWNGKDDHYEEFVHDGDYIFMAQALDIAGNVNAPPKKKITVNTAKKIVTKIIKVSEEDRGLKINLTSKVLFGADKSELKTASYESLDEVIRVLNAYQENKVLIEGHTDSVGSKAVNKKVSMERATAVRDYIVNHGIDMKRITVIGCGEEKPIASNRTRAGQAANRRVEIIILK